MMIPKGAAAEQAVSERAIFSDFVLGSGLRAQLSSIENREPPEPDIRCEIVDEGPIAFELAEVVNEALEQATSERVAARRAFRAQYAALSAEDRAQIEACLGGPPAVFAGFARGVPPDRWRRAVGPIRDILVGWARATSHDRLAEGEIPVWRLPVVKTLLTDLAVRRSHGEPLFGAGEATLAVDATPRLLEKKFRKSYRTDAPIELLAYYIAAPPDDEPKWRASVSEFLAFRTPSSPFRRVWLYDSLARAPWPCPQPSGYEHCRSLEIEFRRPSGCQAPSDDARRLVSVWSKISWQPSRATAP
jgi:hypothetical protein